MGFLSKLKGKMGPSQDVMEEAEGSGYVELDTGAAEDRAKIVVKPYVISDFEHIKEILDDLRDGHTIALVNIKPLKDKDIVELKRAINKLKKTCDAIEGDIAGFGEDWIAAVPSFAHIHRVKKEEAKSQGHVGEVTEYSD
ncbi:MAG: cell division protein SepF [Nanoarchaeota archaeon]|nr:cell division protein SepF [Nanoarchaeota archaeon]MBU1704317.1 cell division protein SepF [Nanoarchaeota archaeon]